MTDPGHLTAHDDECMCAACLSALELDRIANSFRQLRERLQLALERRG